MPEFRYEEWLSEGEKIEYSDYWNDEAQEMSKEWWILDGDLSKMETYLEKIHAVTQLEACVKAAKIYFQRKIKGIGVDLAAGVLWATHHLLRLGAKVVYSVEYSRHRLLRIGPAVLEHYHVPETKTILVLGDFNRLNFSDNMLDFVFMSQAFHHSNKPRELLREIYRVLKPTGVVIITGEHITELKLSDYVCQPLRFIIGRLLPKIIQQKLFGHKIVAHGFWAGQNDVFYIDNVLGDHYYTSKQYERMFQEEGFVYHCLRSCDWSSQAFVLVPVP